MSYARGDIILADLPFTDLSGSKVRPALVVQSDHNNARLDDVILALITRTTARASTEPTQLLVDICSLIFPLRREKRAAFCIHPRSNANISLRCTSHLSNA